MQQYNYNKPHRFRRERKPGDKIGFGIIIVLLGVVLLLKKLHLFYFDWHLMWPIVLIAVGIAIGIKKKFHNHAWWILILIGTVHLVPEFTIMGTNSSSLVVPAAFIIGGLMIIFRSRQKREDCFKAMETVTNPSSILNIDVVFGGRKEIVTSKEFKGGMVSAMFGGVEVNMVQADNNTGEPMVLDLKVNFGGVELIVPAHWEVRNEMSPTFSNVEDERTFVGNQQPGDDKRILVLRGSCSFGNVEIKSY